MDPDLLETWMTYLSKLYRDLVVDLVAIESRYCHRSHLPPLLLHRLVQVLKVVVADGLCTPTKAVSPPMVK
ncbi:hypothetical protein U1Q18_037043, partial [Sarracenia purpurea var. burkii]